MYIGLGTLLIIIILVIHSHVERRKARSNERAFRVKRCSSFRAS